MVRLVRECLALVGAVPPDLIERLSRRRLVHILGIAVRAINIIEKQCARPLISLELVLLGHNFLLAQNHILHVETRQAFFQLRLESILQVLIKHALA